MTEINFYRLNCLAYCKNIDREGRVESVSDKMQIKDWYAVKTMTKAP